MNIYMGDGPYDTRGCSCLECGDDLEMKDSIWYCGNCNRSWTAMEMFINVERAMIKRGELME